MYPVRQYLFVASDQPFDGSGNCFKLSGNGSKRITEDCDSKISCMRER